MCLSSCSGRRTALPSWRSVCWDPEACDLIFPCSLGDMKAFRVGSMAPVSFSRGQPGPSSHHVWGSRQILPTGPARVDRACPQQPHGMVLVSLYHCDPPLSLPPPIVCVCRCPFSIFKHVSVVLCFIPLYFVFGDKGANLNMSLIFHVAPLVLECPTGLLIAHSAMRTHTIDFWS